MMVGKAVKLIIDGKEVEVTNVEISIEQPLMEIRSMGKDVEHIPAGAPIIMVGDVHSPEFVRAPDETDEEQRKKIKEAMEKMAQGLSQALMIGTTIIVDSLGGELEECKRFYEKPYGERPKCSGKYKIGERVRIMQDNPNGAPFKRHNKVKVVSMGLEGYEVADWQGETWWVHEQHIHKKRKK